MTWKSHLRNAAIIIVLLLAGAYWYLSSPDKARVALEDMQGQAPKLTTPRRENFPTIKKKKIVGWPAGAKPSAASGLKVAAFAEKLDHPRWLLELPNGDILVAESSYPARKIDGLEDFIARKLITEAGGAGGSPDRITLLRDADGDGIAETRSVLLDGLHSPFGMALVGARLYVANTDAVVSFPYSAGQLRIDAPATRLVDLPAGPINHH